MFSTFNSSPKSCDHILRTSSECNIQLPCFLLFLISSNFQTIVSNSVRIHHLFPIALNIFLTFPTYNTSFQREPEHTISRPSFYNFLGSSNFYAFKMFTAVPNSKTSIQIATECTAFSTCFQSSLAVQTSKTSFQRAPECTISGPWF